MPFGIFLICYNSEMRQRDGLGRHARRAFRMSRWSASGLPSFLVKTRRVNDGVTSSSPSPESQKKKKKKEKKIHSVLTTHFGNPRCQIGARFFHLNRGCALQARRGGLPDWAGKSAPIARRRGGVIRRTFARRSVCLKYGPFCFSFACIESVCPPPHRVASHY